MGVDDGLVSGHKFAKTINQSKVLTTVTIRVQTVRKTYPAPAHKAGKIVERLICANPGCQFRV